MLRQNAVSNGTFRELKGHRTRTRYAWHFFAALLWQLLVQTAANTFGPEDSCSLPKQESPILWQALSSEDFTSVRLVVFPLGSIEAHGPHLPTGTDMLISEEIARRSSVGLKHVAVLPTSPFGASFEHSSINGTISIRDSTLSEMWIQVLSSVVESGVNKIVCINGHGGQTPNLEIAIRKARFNLNALVVAINLQAMMAETFSEIKSSPGSEWEQVYGIHGGQIETSVMQYLFPNLVKYNKLQRFEPRWKKSSKGLEPYGSTISFGWHSKDILNNGAGGDASLASSSLGEKIVARIVSRIKGLLAELEDDSASEILGKIQ